MSIPPPAPALPGTVKLAAVLFVLPILCLWSFVVLDEGVPIGMIAGQSLLAGVVVVGLLVGARWAWWMAVVLGALWLVSSVVTLVSIVTTEQQLLVMPRLLIVTVLYVVSCGLALILLLSPSGRAAFRRT